MVQQPILLGYTPDWIAVHLDQNSSQGIAIALSLKKENDSLFMQNNWLKWPKAQNPTLNFGSFPSLQGKIVLNRDYQSHNQNGSCYVYEEVILNSSRNKL